MFIIIPKIGEMIQFDLRIFFKWVCQPPTRQILQQIYLSNEKHPGCFGYIGHEILPRSLCSDNYNQPWHKDPFSTTEFFIVFMADYNESSISWKVSEFLFSWLT